MDVARWQFGVTTVYHFLFVPMTIGMSLLVAIMQTIWYRTRDEKWLRLTKFFGKLFLINFAMGIVTGIVQEFQFGMNWSDYSRFVGDVFGSLLAIEALVAFFLESTFLGLWIFGWERLPKPIHLATIWAASIGTILSMYFILAANSWMQNPVGFHINPDTGRAELNSIGALLTNKVTLATFPHTFFGALMVAGGMVVAVALWHLYRGRDDQKPAFRTAVTFGGWVTILATAGTLISGDFQGKIMTEVQPMKMAAARGSTRRPAPRRSRCSRSAAWTAAGRSSRSPSRTCCPGSARVTSTRRSRASTTFRSNTPRSTARASTTRRSSRSRTGRSA